MGGRGREEEGRERETREEGGRGREREGGERGEEACNVEYLELRNDLITCCGKYTWRLQ